jgi:mannose-1-phosphate guanylyltransferase
MAKEIDMIEHYYGVIMAGGGGTRLWPLSRKGSPKQMLKLVDDRSLFQIAVDRLEGLLPPERILVVTVEDQAPGLQVQCPAIPEENFLLEPMPRGTASVVAYAAAVLHKKDPESVMAVLTADHIIGNLGLFQQVLTAANQIAAKDFLVTLGITPTYPATGYGYIRKGDQIGEYLGLSAFRVHNFTEKPAQKDAETMLASGEYVWNSGMFIWRTEAILNEVSRQMPGLFSTITDIKEAWGTEQQESKIREVWPGIEPQTIDFGIMENAENVAVIPARDLAWNDVGSWDAIFDLLQADEQGNINQGAEQIKIDTTGTLVFSEGDPRLVVTIGVEDLVIVDTGEILLICKRDQAQDVRRAVEELKSAGREDLI